MFGGQDDNAQVPQNGSTTAPHDDTLNGVADLVGGAVAPAPTDSDAIALPTPTDQQPGAPATSDMPVTAVAPTQALPDTDSDALLDLKQAALQQLTPLVGQLDQSPEDKFRTTMMLIQASDNKELLKEAYDAAQAITDDKARAQALLDVINEINYFTQQSES